MSLPQLVFIVVLVTAAHLVDAAFGDIGKAAAFSGLGAIGLVATVLNERRGVRLREALARMEPETRNEVLVRLENSEMRADAVIGLGIEPPRVPLRRSVETFACSETQARAMRWSTRLWLLVGALLLLGYATDRILGREVFFRWNQPWWETAGIVLVCIVGTGASWWLARRSKAVVLVSDGAVELQFPGQPVRRIPWEEITAAQVGGLPRRLRLVSDAHTIVVLSETIQGFGRLLNLALSRLPAGVRLRAE